MSQINKLVLPAMLLAASLLLTAGCADPNANSGFDTDSGTHIAGWLPSGHALSAEADVNSCQECHGADYAGGISGVSCTTCHLGGTFAIHPADWQNNALLNHRWYAFQNGSASCSNAYCHGTNLSGVAESGPACGTCHSPVPSAANCSGCHEFPPVNPTVAGKHAVHTQLSGADCSICHENNDHLNGVVNVNFQSLFSAKSGSAAFDSGSDTCSNISCHGGQTTPSWQAGTIDVNTQCTMCHSFGSAQYNGFVSGEHDFHVNSEGISCTSCHDTVQLAVNHFTKLNTQAMEGPASATISGSGIISYSNGSCTANCHETRSW